MRTLRTLRRQRGVAVVTALLLTTLAVTIVASLFWQQQVQVRSMENQRLHLQTRWILRGALDWARLILRTDGQGSLTTVENGVWATPLAETRLDDYVERERLQNEDYNATLKGRIYDAQSRYNLANLVNGANDVRAFGRLLGALQLDSGLAQAAAQLVTKGATATAATGGSQTLAIQRVDDLAAAGFAPAAIERLRDYVVVLPVGEGVNANTAPAEVLMAVVDNLSLSTAQTLVAARKSTSFSSAGAFTQAAGGGTLLTTVVVRSNYFLVLSQVQLDRASLESWALIKRLERERNSLTSLVWIREI